MGDAMTELQGVATADSTASSAAMTTVITGTKTSPTLLFLPDCLHGS